MKAKLSAAAAATVAASLSVLGQAGWGGGAASAASSGPARRVTLTWAPVHVASDQRFTRRQALAVARRFDLVSALPISFRRYVRGMRRANPSLRLFVYSKATTATSATASGLPEQEFAHDAGGSRIRSSLGAYLMEPSNAGWRHTAVQQCVDKIAASHYDGCLLDGFAMAIFSNGFARALPVVPGTGQVYTKQQWRDQMMNLAGAFAAHRPRLRYLGNAVGNAYTYWDADVTTRPIVQSLPGALMESFMRDTNDSATDFPTGQLWRQNLAVVQDSERSGRTGLFMTKLWVPATNALVKQWLAYAMATFLLGANGHSYFAFADAPNIGALLGKDLPYRMPRHLGSPTSGLRHAHGTFRRHFAHGIAVVNPTTNSHTVRLHGAYLTLGGRRVTRLRLAPHSGQVLRAARQ